MMDNVGSKTSQFQFWRARRPLIATPEKERAKCDVQQGYGELRQLTVLGFSLLKK